MRSAPARARLVRLKGVGLITADGAEWLSIGRREYVAKVRGNLMIVRSCTRPSQFANPWRIERSGRGTWGVRTGPRCKWRAHGIAKDDATEIAVQLFRDLTVRNWPLRMFTELAAYNALACWCKHGRPCHVDEILIEGARRGVWETPNEDR